MRPVPTELRVERPNWTQIVCEIACEIARDARFWAAYQVLPPEIRRLARSAYQLFTNDPNHLSLRFKKVHDSDSVY